MKYLVLIFCLFLISGCSSGNTYKTISYDEAYETMSANENIILLDVRTVEEYEDEHIVGAINIPIDDISESISLDKEATIYVYCESGNRSKMATIKLNELGYTNVYDMGGINDYPYEVE